MTKKAPCSIIVHLPLWWVFLPIGRLSPDLTPLRNQDATSLFAGTSLIESYAFKNVTNLCLKGIIISILFALMEVFFQLLQAEHLE